MLSCEELLASDNSQMYFLPVKMFFFQGCVSSGRTLSAPGIFNCAVTQSSVPNAPQFVSDFSRSQSFCKLKLHFFQYNMIALLEIIVDLITNTRRRSYFVVAFSRFLPPA